MLDLDTGVGLSSQGQRDLINAPAPTIAMALGSLDCASGDECAWKNFPDALPHLDMNSHFLFRIAKAIAAQNDTQPIRPGISGKLTNATQPKMTRSPRGPEGAAS